MHNVLLEEGTATYPGLRGTLLSNIAWQITFLHDCGIQPDALESSFPVSRLDIFLSHSWSSSGLWKQVALIMSFYLPFAFKWMVWSTLPLAGLVYWASNSVNLGFLLIVILGFGAFLSGLFASRFFKHSRTTVFLDKCCISQVDPVERMHGISRLSEYLSISGKFVILWSPDYFKRLWCVYELACFLQTHDERDVIVIHPGHVKCCTEMILLGFLCLVISNTSELYSQSCGTCLATRCTLVWIVTFLFVGQRTLSSVSEIDRFYERLRVFKMSVAKCSDLGDELYLKALIREAYGSLEHFEEIVRGIWMGAEVSSRGPYWLFSRTSLMMLCAPYIPYVVGGAILTVAYILDGSLLLVTDLVPSGPTDSPPATLWSFVNICLPEVNQLILLVCHAPFSLLLGYRLALRYTQFSGCCRSVVILICYSMYSCVSMVLIVINELDYTPFEGILVDRVYRVPVRASGIVLSIVIISFTRRAYGYDISAHIP